MKEARDAKAIFNRLVRYIFVVRAAASIFFPRTQACRQDVDRYRQQAAEASSASSDEQLRIAGVELGAPPVREGRLSAVACDPRAKATAALQQALAETKEREAAARKWVTATGCKMHGIRDVLITDPYQPSPSN